MYDPLRRQRRLSVLCNPGEVLYTIIQAPDAHSSNTRAASSSCFPSYLLNSHYFLRLTFHCSKFASERITLLTIYIYLYKIRFVLVHTIIHKSQSLFICRGTPRCFFLVWSWPRLYFCVYSLPLYIDNSFGNEYKHFWFCHKCAMGLCWFCKSFSNLMGNGL